MKALSYTFIIDWTSSGAPQALRDFGNIWNSRRQTQVVGGLFDLISQDFKLYFSMVFIPTWHAMFAKHLPIWFPHISHMHPICTRRCSATRLALFLPGLTCMFILVGLFLVAVVFGIYWSGFSSGLIRWDSPEDLRGHRETWCGIKKRGAHNF